MSHAREIQKIVEEEAAEFADWLKRYNELTVQGRERVDIKVEELAANYLDIAKTILPGLFSMSQEQVEYLCDEALLPGEGLTLYTNLAVALADDLLVRAEALARREVDPDDYLPVKGARERAAKREERKETAHDG